MSWHCQQNVDRSIFYERSGARRLQHIAAIEQPMSVYPGTSMRYECTNGLQKMIWQGGCDYACITIFKSYDGREDLVK